MPVAAAAASPAAAEPLPVPLWLSTPLHHCWRARAGGSTPLVVVAVVAVGAAMCLVGSICVPRAAIAPIVATVAGPRSAAPP